MSSASITTHPAKSPCLIAAAAFVALAVLIGSLAAAPLGAADLVGISACAAAAGVFATLAFTLRVPAPPVVIRDAVPAPVAPAAQSAGLDATALSTLIDERLAAAFAAADEKRRAEVAAAVAATTPPRAVDAAAVPAPSAGAKPRLGRGLLGLMHSPEALARAAAAPASPSVPVDPVAADDQEPERAAA